MNRGMKRNFYLEIIHYFRLNVSYLILPENLNCFYIYEKEITCIYINDSSHDYVKYI